MVLVIVQWLLWFVLAAVVPEALMVAFAGARIDGVAQILHLSPREARVWWLDCHGTLDVERLKAVL